MTKDHWKLDDIPWDRFEPSRALPDVVSVVKAAALVEYNAADYAETLCRVFVDYPMMQDLVRGWAEEEIQHGAALGRWATLADSGYDFSAAVARFRAGYRVPVAEEGRASVRGSCSGELVARCIVETGTSSFYRAIADASEEPVLRLLCRRIAADEFRHYKLFLDRLNHYLAQEGVGRARRLWVALGRIAETQDDELAYAYYAANWATAADAPPYQRERAAQAYERRAFGLYQRQHIDRAAAMVVKACGFSPQSWWFGTAQRLGWWLVVTRVRRLSRAGA